MISAVNREPLDRPPIWFMRQAGRYLPEYRRLRSRYSFTEAMTSPEIAAEITIQPLRRFSLDAAIVFSDIMAPLTGMGVRVEFDPGPRIDPMTTDDVGRLETLDPRQVAFVAETIGRVKSTLDPNIAVIGFAGGPVTLLAYLLEGGGSRQFPALRRALHEADPSAALSVLTRSVRTHLETQIAAGADLVQVFDTWAGLLSAPQFGRWVVPSVRQVLAGLGVPTIYFVPGGAHLLDLMPGVGADAYGVDWRLGLDEVWSRIGEERVLQGNLDPTVLLTAPDVVRSETRRVLAEVAGRPGHIFNLGHGILPSTPLVNVSAMVETVIGEEYDVARPAERTLAR
jgi:uroporphyrinogen decarboxylase